MDAADLLGDWAVRDHVLTLGRSFDPRAFELRRAHGPGYIAGLWLTGAGGRFEGTGGGTTMIGGFGLVDVPRWPARTSRAGLDGEVLVLLDAAGAQVGRLERGRERAWPDRVARPRDPTA